MDYCGIRGAVWNYGPGGLAAEEGEGREGEEGVGGEEKEKRWFRSMIGGEWYEAETAALYFIITTLLANVIAAFLSPS